MTSKPRTRTMIVLAVMLTSTAFLLVSSPAPSDPQKIKDNLGGVAAAGTPSPAAVQSDAPTVASQENKHVVAAVPQKSDGRKTPARGRDAERNVVRLPGEVPFALASAKRMASGAHTDEPLALTVVLRRDDQQGFEEFLRGVQDPQSPTYRHYLSPRAQADRFGPSQSEYKTVAAWLRRKGFTLVEASTNRLTLTVRGTRKTAEQAFGVEIADYRRGDRTFYANDRNPALSMQIAPYVQAVVGLSNLAQPGSAFEAYIETKDLCMSEAALKALNGNRVLRKILDNHTDFRDTFHERFKEYWRMCLIDHGIDPDLLGNGPPGGLGGSGRGSVANGSDESLAQKLKALAAVPWKNVTGAGQTIGLLEFDTFKPSDISDYLALTGFPASDINRLSQVHVNGGAPLGPQEAEVLVDIIAAMINARGARVVVYDAPFGGIRTSFQTLFNRMIGDGVTVISNSWVYCEDQTSPADAQSIDTVLASAAAAGISVLNSTGDFGSQCVDGSGNTISVPADSPHATAVGGTSPTTGPAFTYGSETFWNGLNDTPPTGAGGFGVSRFFNRPSYQDGFTNSTARSVPDISVNGDPGKGMFICQADAGGCPTGVTYGGTSLSAPLWAAFVAQLNEAQGQNLGALNPRLYPLGNTDAFHSAASMGSDFQHVGLGSPNLDLIHRALSGKTAGAVSPSDSQVDTDPSILLPDNTTVSEAVADGASQAFVVVRLRDAEGHTISGKTVALTANSGAQATVAPTSGVSNVSNGAVVFSVKDTTAEAVTFTATDTTDNIALPTQATVVFIEPPATAGGINASPTTVNANGSDTTTITVTLQDAKGNPSPNKIVSLSQGNGASIISATTATTDATGKVLFTAVDNKAETVTYTAVDVTDGDLPVPGSATVNFVNAAGFCAGTNSFRLGTAAPDYAVTTFASNFPLDCFSGVGPIGLAFDQNSTLLVGDTQNNNLYAFGQQGDIAGPATLVGTVPGSFGTGLAGLAVTKDGRLYALLPGGNNLVELNPATAAVIRVVTQFGGSAPVALAVDPLSGDLFASGFDGIERISNFATGPGTVTHYATGNFDGIAFAPDGTLYAAANLQGGIYRVAGTNSQTPGTLTVIAFLPGRPDGIAIEPNSTNPARPILYVNRNDGTITRIDMSALPGTPESQCSTGCSDIYTGGSRGDFVTVGPSGCLFATQSDRVIRITKADGTCSLTPTNPAPQIVLTPENVQPAPAQGTNVTFTAQLKNVASPEGVPVTLFVSGANGIAKLARADKNGTAKISYIGVLTGTDKVFAAADLGTSTITSNDAQVTWTPGQHSTFLTLNLSPSSGAPNQPLTVVATLVDFSVAPVAGIAGVPLSFALAGQTCNGTTNANGTASCTITPNVAPGSYSLVVNFPGTSGLLANSANKTVDLIAPPTLIQFSVANYQVGEGDGHLTVTVNRSGDSSGSASVAYQTVDTDTFTVGCADTVNNHGSAYARCDFATVVGALTFAAGETTKTIAIPIIDDVHAEGDETFQIVLSNPTGASLGVPAAATITIHDNDTTPGAPNPIFRTDFFVRQHYLDFLSREPDTSGFNAWTNLLNNCSDVNNNPQCDRLTVSQSFFQSQEFQLKGFYVFRFYRVAFNRLPEYLEQIADMSFVTAPTAQEVFQRKAQFATNFIQRTEFQTDFGALSNNDFVTTLLGRYHLTQVTTIDPANPDGSSKVTLTSADLVNQLNNNTLTRAQVLRAIADSDQVGAAEFNNAFVGMQYYGYLRRKPEASGFQAWLKYLNANPTDFRTMVNGFVNSQEYKLRFGSPNQ